MVALRVTLASLVIALGACSVGEVPIGGGGADGGAGGTKAGFDTNIKGMVMTKGCVIAACHGGTQSPNFTSYDTLDAKYKAPPAATNKLITEAADGATHNGVTYFTTAEKVTVTSWIEGH
jgi:hypothetical protein